MEGCLKHILISQKYFLCDFVILGSLEEKTLSCSSAQFNFFSLSRMYLKHSKHNRFEMLIFVEHPRSIYAEDGEIVYYLPLHQVEITGGFSSSPILKLHGKPQNQLKKQNQKQK